MSVNSILKDLKKAGDELNRMVSGRRPQPQYQNSAGSIPQYQQQQQHGAPQPQTGVYQIPAPQTQTYPQYQQYPPAPHSPPPTQNQIYQQPYQPQPFQQYVPQGGPLPPQFQAQSYFVQAPQYAPVQQSPVPQGVQPQALHAAPSPQLNQSQSQFQIPQHASTPQGHQARPVSVPPQQSSQIPPTPAPTQQYAASPYTYQPSQTPAPPQHDTPPPQYSQAPPNSQPTQPSVPTQQTYQASQTTQAPPQAAPSPRPVQSTAVPSTTQSATPAPQTSQPPQTPGPPTQPTPPPQSFPNTNAPQGAQSYTPSSVAYQHPQPSGITQQPLPSPSTPATAQQYSSFPPPVQQSVELPTAQYRLPSELPSQPLQPPQNSLPVELPASYQQPPVNSIPQHSQAFVAELPADFEFYSKRPAPVTANQPSQSRDEPKPTESASASSSTTTQLNPQPQAQISKAFGSPSQTEQTGQASNGLSAVPLEPPNPSLLNRIPSQQDQHQGNTPQPSNASPPVAHQYQTYPGYHAHVKGQVLSSTDQPQPQVQAQPPSQGDISAASSSPPPGNSQYHAYPGIQAQATQESPSHQQRQPQVQTQPPSQGSTSQSLISSPPGSGQYQAYPGTKAQASQGPSAQQQTQPQVQPQAQTQTAQSLGAVLTKYTRFFVFKDSTVPRPDPTVQDLSFCVCETCFSTEISLRPEFANSFELYNSPDCVEPTGDEVQIPSSRAICDFGMLPLARTVFHIHCLSQNSLQPLIGLAKKFDEVPPCPSNETRDGGEFYTSPAIPDCAICVKCYEMYFKPYPFGNQFNLKLQPAGQLWFCDIGKDPGFIWTTLKAQLSSPAPQFIAIAQTLNERLSLNPCPGQDQNILPAKDGQIHVYGLPGTEITVCQECFFDRIKATSFESLFTLLNKDPSKYSCTCDLASGIAKYHMKVALQAGQLQIWQQGLQDLVQLPKCVGITGLGEEVVEQHNTELGPLASWYHVTGFPTVEACPSCFHCIVKPSGVGHLFTPVSRQLRAGVVRICNFWIGNGGISSMNPNDFPTTLQWRGFMLRHMLDIGWESKQGDFSAFTYIAKLFKEAGPPCGGQGRGFKKPCGRKWFGHISASQNDENDCTIVMCEECYNENVKDTPLKEYLGRDLTKEVYEGDVQNQKEAFCGPWSKRSKAAIKEAADAKDFRMFARHWNQRERMKMTLLPQIQLMQVQFQSQQALKMSAMNNAIMVQGGASISEAAGVDGYDHGNSTVGYGFASAAGVNAAMWKRDADKEQWGDIGLIGKIAILEAQWKAIE
ncbi:hypothetical protein B0J14DRAFT_596673 [Halenospora varia]|nr:hypothetical protein B0J14DRAFT_596673 [Halenospora varia]